MWHVEPDFDLKQKRYVVRIVTRPATLQKLVLYTQGHSKYNIYIAETNKYQSHRGHIVYWKIWKIGTRIFKTRSRTQLPGIIHFYINNRYKCP